MNLPTMPRISCVPVRFFSFSRHPSLPSRSLQRRHELPSPAAPDHARLSPSTPSTSNLPLGPSLSPRVVAPPSPLTSSERGSASSPPPVSSANACRRRGRELRAASTRARVQTRAPPQPHRRERTHELCFYALPFSQIFNEGQGTCARKSSDCRRI
jgi:hypothetical protein